MSTSKVIYLGELRTNAEHLRSGNSILTDAPPDNHGKGEYFSPTDLTATSLGSCMLTVIGIYAQNNSIEMKGSNVEIKKIMNVDGPRKISKISVNLNIITSEPLDLKQQLIFRKIAETCPVALSIHPDIHQDLNIAFTSS